MKKILFDFVLVVSIACLYLGFAWPGSSVNFLFDRNGVPVESVSNVFKHLGVSVFTLDQANEFAQKNLLRKGERWDTQDEKEWHSIAQEKKALLLNDLKSLGMIDAVEPRQLYYMYALVMGALKQTVVERLDYLAKLKQSGFDFENIVLLGGERQLRDVERDGLPKDVTTEAQMMQYLHANHSILKNDKILLVNAPMIQEEDGSFARPTTDGTIAYFAQMVQEDGACLIISNNPYVLRQTKVAQRILDQTRFPTEGAGKKANQETIDIIMLLDEFARTLHEEYQQVKANCQTKVKSSYPYQNEKFTVGLVCS